MRHAERGKDAGAGDFFAAFIDHAQRDEKDHGKADPGDEAILVQHPRDQRGGMGLRDPIWQQFGRYVGGVVQGDLGQSFVRSARLPRSWTSRRNRRARPAGRLDTRSTRCRWHGSARGARLSSVSTPASWIAASALMTCADRPHLEQKRHLPGLTLVGQSLGDGLRCLALRRVSASFSA
ncbi:hypothetical protein [Paracoccus mutanolyticus]|uniref:hypothetical protein n=1 Tax=Paracoccus mutanolyticus TaxID=1499308 RepID=UPI0021D529F3|nr:hypothetical protein [Paracoccus mutanolyticus]